MTRMGSTSLNLMSSSDHKNLELLFEAFGSKVSVEDMAAAYCEVGRDVYKASEILYRRLGGSSSNSTPVSNGAVAGAAASSGGSSVAAVARPRDSANGAQQVPSRPKPRNGGVAVGTVSGVIGANYARGRVPTGEFRAKSKPVKLMSSEFPETELWDEKEQARSETMSKDVEEFVVKMLGNGFQLDMNVIREVVGGCGYDAKESVEKLMNISAPTFDLGDAPSSAEVETSSEKSPERVDDYQSKSQSGDSAGSFEADNEYGRVKRAGLEQEVLTKLFTVPERCKEGPRKPLPRRQPGTRKYGVVTGPLKHLVAEFTTPIVQKEESKEDEDDYEALREAVKQYWMTMKKYYIAALDAYVKGNYETADKLLKEGHFYMDKARETNEKSAKKFLLPSDDGETISIDVHDYEPREAVRLLKTQLKSMSGIPSIHYLKVVLGPNDNDTKQRTCKRLISKLLERDGIAWTDEQDGPVMRIRVDVIDPKRLSFNQKQDIPS